MKSIFIFLLSFTILALLTTTAFPQTMTTGSIAGTVTDRSGAAVPDMTVTVTSPNLIQAQSAETARDGHYSILNLPPGKYTIAIAAAKGFAKFEEGNIDVNLGKTSQGDIQLRLGGVQEEMSVTAGAPVDVVQTTTGANVSTDQFSNFPTRRTVQGLYTIAPAVARSGLRDASGPDRDPSVAGSSGPENPIPPLEGEARTCHLNLSKKSKSRQAVMAPSTEERPAVSSTLLPKAGATTFTVTFSATARAKGSSAPSRIFPSQVLPQTVLQKRILAQTRADRSRRISSGISPRPIRNGARTIT